MTSKEIEKRFAERQPMTTWGNSHIEFLLSEIHRLRGAINKHKLEVWSDWVVTHPHDKELYKALEEE